MAENLIGIEIGNGEVSIYGNSKMVVMNIPDNLVKDSRVIDIDKFS